MATVTGVVASTSPIATQSVTAGTGKSATVTQTLAPISQAGAATYAGRTATITNTLAPISQSASVLADYTTAQIVNTLAPIVQAGEGETIYFTLTSSATAGETLLVFDEQTLTDTALVGDSISAIITNEQTDTAVASDSQEVHNYTWLTDNTATASNTLQSSNQTTTLVGTARASDKLTATATAIMVDTMTAADTQTTGVTTSLHTSGYASSSTTDTAVKNQLLTASAVASGDPTYFISEMLTDTATAEGYIVEYAGILETLTGSAVASDSQVNYATCFEELSGSASADNQILFEGSVYNNTLTASAVANGIPWARDYGAVAWVMNTETGGLSQYLNYEFHSIAEYGGILYATSPEGVFALTGDDDAGRGISAEVRTGFLDFGTEQTKRLSDLFVGYTADGLLECEVETYDGPQEVYTYTMEERDANAPRNNRLKIGRGLSSRYWRFAIKNVDGADFQIYDVTAEVGTSRRRL